MSDIIIHNINSIDVGQRPDDGYINLTKMTKASGKAVADYLKIASTKAFLKALSSDMKIFISTSEVSALTDPPDREPSRTITLSSSTASTQNTDSTNGQSLIYIKKGGVKTEQGTWAHPKVAIHCAQWCSPEFAVMVTNWVFDWMNSGQTPEITPLPDPEPKPLNLPEPSNEECDFADRLQQLKELVALGDRLGLEDSDRLMLKRRWRELIHLPNGEREISIAERAEELGYRPTPIELIRIGQIASSFYRDRHGAAPEKRKQSCGNVERSVNVYRHGDLIVIDSAIEAVMGKKR